MVFKDGGFVGDSELNETGKQILRKCGYVPLLVRLVGAVLSWRKKDMKVWRSFLENELSGVVAGDTGDKNMMQVLEVSYNDLPLALKRCFAYCSVFPKGYDFEKDILIRMWIAQGFIEPHTSKTLEEIGDDYFFYMVNSNLFQEVKKYKSDFEVVKYTFKMHDFLHDLATQIAGAESTSFSEADLKKNVESSTPLRHISMTFSPNISISLDYPNLSSNSNSLRTLILANTHHMKIDSFELVLDRFRTLRTLVLSNLNHTTFPDSFGDLIHLRYLDLSQNHKLTTLPNSICKLYHLKTLLLNMCRKLERLPSNLMKLVSLRHLFLEGCWKLDSMPSGFASLTTLVSLDRFIVHPEHGGLRNLGRLDHLCGMLKLELPMKGWTDCVEDARQAKMSSKCRLSGLSIRWECEDWERRWRRERPKEALEELQPHANLQNLQIENYTSDNLPSWFSSLSNIKSLNLKRCSLEYLDVSVRFGYLLPHLEVLRLVDLEYLRGWWREVASPTDNSPMPTVLTIPRVSKLEISKCSGLVENMPLFQAVEDLVLRVGNVRLLTMLLSNPPQYHNDYRSKLQVLHLFSIESLECLPEGLLKHLTALQCLQISDCEELRWISRRGLACLTSLEKLYIDSCRVVRLDDEDVDEPMHMGIKNKNSYMYCGLQRLRILRMPWQHDLLKEGLCFLTSLQHLDITYYEEHQVEVDNQNSEICESAPKELQRVCLRLGSIKCCFPKWTLHLPCLQALKLWNFGEISVGDWATQQTQSKTLVTLRIHSPKELILAREIPWKLLPSLRALTFLGELSSIPDGIQQLTSLQHLEICDSRNLEGIPKWMINFTSLQRLVISLCSKELKGHCNPKTGIYWHLISHIPCIMINGSIQEVVGRYDNDTSQTRSKPAYVGDKVTC